MKQLLWLVCLIPSISFSQIIKYRAYKKGEKFRYKLTSETFNNNQPTGTTISISSHKVIEDSGYLCEEIHWLSKTVFAKDTLHLDSIAQKVTPYKISLSPKGTLNIPPLTIAEMTGEITDLNTFYVAVSPTLHVQKLSPRLFSFKDSVLHGHFADGKQILSGEDCIEVTQKLLTHDNKTTFIETLFMPPINACIVPLIDTIGKQIFSVPNNFQMVRKGNGNKVNLLWGVEEFIISSTIDNRTGQLLKAEMVNLLTLRMRLNSSEDFKTFDAEFPLTIKRILHLELLK